MSFLPPQAVIAHRGDSHRFPENTLPALQGALEAGAVMAEVDLSLSADHKVVILHDETLERTTNGQGPLEQKSYEDLRKLDAGAWFAPDFAQTRLPSLDEVLELAQGRMLLNLEIKPQTFERGQEAFIRHLVETLRLRQQTAEVLISSFAPQALLALAEQAPEIKLALLAEAPLDASAWGLLKRLKAYAFHTAAEAVRSEDATALAGGGYNYLAYTLNQAEEARKLFALGLGGVFSDDPRLLQP